MPLGRTPWVDRTIRHAWDRIAALVPPTWMPSTRDSTSARPSFEELGCGHYGCVMPTSEPGLVCKLTSDVSEARFVALSRQLGPQAPRRGIVQYFGIFTLAGMTHKGRPLFVLWRSEASDIGILINYNGRRAAYVPQGAEPFAGDDYVIRALKTEGIPMINQFLDEAGVARKFIAKKLRELERSGATTIDRRPIHSAAELLQLVWSTFEQSEHRFILKQPSWGDYGAAERLGAPKHIAGLARVGVALANCQYAAEMLGSTQYVDSIGFALESYLEQGLLLADVHLNNIGMTLPWEEGYEDQTLGITDPGHVVEIHPQWLGRAQIVEI